MSAAMLSMSIKLQPSFEITMAVITVGKVQDLFIVNTGNWFQRSAETTARIPDYQPHDNFTVVS